jgi:AcrR family transcriptional regulator
MSGPVPPAKKPRPEIIRRQAPRDPEKTRAAILDAGIAEFAAGGFGGARVDAIAARTRTTKRMLYYYFGSKQGLYEAVLEHAYGGIRDAEADLGLDALPPLEALERLVGITFDYHAAHPDFVRLVATENINSGRTIAASKAIAGRNDRVIRIITQLLERGARAGVFRDGIDPFALHILMSSFCFYRVANRYTLGVIFGRDMTAPEAVAAQRRMIIEAVLTWVSRSPPHDRA